MKPKACYIDKPIGAPDKRIEPIKPHRKAWIAYHALVWRLTEEASHLVDGIERRGFKDHHIDHIKSVWRGFKNGDPPEQIADVSNLRMLPYKENMIKGRR